MRRYLLLASCLTAGAGILADARCEVFVLKTGGRIEAEHLNPQRERGQPYQLRTSEGIRLALADSAVARVIVKTDVDRQYEAQVAKLDNTVEGHWNIAEWCKEAGLSDQRRRHLLAIIEINPNHEEARRALGYQRFGDRWLTQDEHMVSMGYVKYKGTWRVKQEVEIAQREEQEELAVKKLRKDIRLWLDQAAGGRFADMANRNLNAIQDPAAVPALVENLADLQQPRAVRQRCLEMLKRLPYGGAARTLSQVAMNDPNDGIREGCLDLLKAQGVQQASSWFIPELKGKDNARINRAADCIGYLGDKDATLPLINALVTEHRETIQSGGGGLTPSFNGNGAGSFSAGSKTVTINRRLENAGVRNALTTLHPGEPHNFDMEAWRAWYIKTQTTSNVNLRRDD